VNIAILFLSDLCTSSKWNKDTVEDVSFELADQSIKILYTGKKSSDIVLQLPEGTKIWEARIGLEKAWNRVAGEHISFIPRSGKELAIAYHKTLSIYESQAVSKKGTSSGIVFIDTHKIESTLDSESERLHNSLVESLGKSTVLRRLISLGDLIVIKEGKESAEPSFTRIARVVQDSYRPILERPFHIAGRGLTTSLKDICSLIEECSPRMFAEVSNLAENR